MVLKQKVNFFYTDTEIPREKTPTSKKRLVRVSGAAKPQVSITKTTVIAPVVINEKRGDGSF